MSAWFSGVGQFLGDVCVLVVDLGAVVPVQVSHLRVHDALVGGREHLGRWHVLVVPRVAVAANDITTMYAYVEGKMKDRRSSTIPWRYQSKGRTLAEPQDTIWIRCCRGDRSIVAFESVLAITSRKYKRNFATPLPKLLTKH